MAKIFIYIHKCFDKRKTQKKHKEKTRQVKNNVKKVKDGNYKNKLIDKMSDKRWKKEGKKNKRK